MFGKDGEHYLVYTADSMQTIKLNLAGERLRVVIFPGKEDGFRKTSCRILSQDEIRFRPFVWQRNEGENNLWVISMRGVLSKLAK